MPSKLGIHGIMEGGTLGTLRQLASMGTTMPTIKAVEGPGWLKDVKAIDPTIQTVGRFIRGEDRGMDVEGPPIMSGDLKKTANDVMYNIIPRWEEHRAYVDYWEIINEQDPPGTEGHRRLAEFMIHCIDIAEAEGYNLSLFSYSLGVPEWEEMEAIVQTGVFGRAKAGGHSLSLHEYAYPIDVWYGEPLPGRPTYADRGPLSCRYRWWYEDFLKPRNEVIPLFLTEVNVARDLPLVPQQEWMDQMAWYDARMREDYYVVGAHLFTLGSGGGWVKYEFNDRLPLLIEHIAGLKDAQDPTWPEAPVVHAPSEPIALPSEPGRSGGQPVKPQPIDDPKPIRPADAKDLDTGTQLSGGHYLLLPPEADWSWIAACQRFWEKFRVTIGTSLEQAGNGQGVTVVNPDAWDLDLQTYFHTHHPGVKYDPIMVRSPRELTMFLNWRAENNRPFGG